MYIFISKNTHLFDTQLIAIPRFDSFTAQTVFLSFFSSFLLHCCSLFLFSVIFESYSTSLNFFLAFVMKLFAAFS